MNRLQSVLSIVRLAPLRGGRQRGRGREGAGSEAGAGAVRVHSRAVQVDPGVTALGISLRLVLSFFHLNPTS